MAEDVQTAPGTSHSVAPLLSGIINDIQDLLKQNLALFKVEVKEDLKKTKESFAALGAGIALAALGSLLLVLMLVHLLNWAVPALPLWACFGIVGGILTGAGLALYLRGKAKLESFNPLPAESAEALMENVQCITKSI